MAHTKSILFYSLLAALVSMPYDASAAVRINNKSRGHVASNEQVNTIRNPAPAIEMQQNTAESAPVEEVAAEPTPAEATLPLRVADKLLGLKIANGQDAPVSMAQLENCAAIYPNGEFEWNSPTVGSKRATGDQCVSIVEMRAFQQGPDGEDLVVARTRLAAGDSVPCNISAWPEGSWLESAGTIEFPADAEPTLKDVEKQMNQEQKQNAGIKIAAGTVLAAVAGNAMGKSAPGKETLLGANKDKLESTAIGAAAGAALMAGSVYGGKVAGDMIMSATVNAAAGGVIGNMAASGESILQIEPCALPGVAANKKTDDQKTDDKKADSNGGDAGNTSGKAGKTGGDNYCVWGVYRETEAVSNKDLYYNTQDKTYKECPSETSEDKDKTCKTARLIAPKLYFKDEANAPYKYEKGKSAFENAENDLFRGIETSYEFDDATRTMTQVSGAPNATGKNVYVKLASASSIKTEGPALVILKNENIPMFGFSKEDWTNRNGETKKNKAKLELYDSKVYRRGVDGNPSGELTTMTADNEKNFEPSEQSAEDGGLLDLDNKARLKGTMIGAGSGAAMGAFSAYQGAKSDIQIRWEQEVRSYKDSLSRVYCATGGRFLSSYNDTVLIPSPRQE